MEKEVSSITRFLIPALALIALKELLLFAARPDVVRMVRKRCNGCCEKCKTYVGKKIIVAHINHEKNNDYDNPEKLQGLCLFCEIKHHLKFLCSPLDIGLSQDINDSVCWGHFLKLKRLEKQIISDEFPEEIIYLKKKYSKKK